MAISTYQWLGEIMRSDAVRVVLDRVADELETRLNAVVAQHGGAKVAGTVNRYDGTRPKGRPYDQVGLNAVPRLTAEQELAQANGDPNAALTARLTATVRSPTV